MAKYYVHTKPDAQGNHEVHESSCAWLPAAENRIYLGEFSNCRDAVSAARTHFSNVDGCAHCSPACNHG